MKLKSLEVIGFKSFVDRLHLSFPEGITTIVGPNGCGKSNIVDSVLWAIGERSPKHLRGKSMEDVIFGGTDGRKPLGMAEVSLTFSNEDGSAPKAYEHYGEICITRRLFRSGESEYLLNKVPCRLRDITDLFLDTGIGVNGYSIVEQGRVERLINANPEDRRFLIEEAAGIAKYKERKRLALMKMEATQQNLVRIQDIITEVKRQIGFLERQVKRAEEYRAIRKEMKEIEIRFALREYAELMEKGEASKGYLKALQDRERENSTQVAKQEALIEGMRLNGMEEEEKLRSVQQEVFDLGRRIQKLESEIEFFRKEEGNLQRQEGQHVQEVRDALHAWRMAQRESREMEASCRDLKEKRDRDAETLREMEFLSNDVKARYLSLQAQLEEEKGELIDSITRLTSFKNRLAHLEERMEDHQRRIRSSQKESEEVGAGLARLEQDLSGMSEQREKSLSIQSALQEEKIRWEEEIEGLKGTLRERQRERAEIEEVLRQDRSRYLSLKELQESFEGYEKGVRSILLRKREEEEKWGGVLGAVADILEPDPQYEVPLEAVLGERLQFLIVEGEKVGLEAVAFLKRESAGRGSFILKEVQAKGRLSESSAGPAGLVSAGTTPVPAPSSGDVPTLTDFQPESSGCLTGAEKNGRPFPLKQVVNIREGFTPIAEFLFGDVGVVKNGEEALHWMKEDGPFHTFVTLEGDVFERSGVISGGRRDQGLGILERRRMIRELEERAREGEERCRKAYEEEGRLQQEVTDKEGRLEERKREIQGKEIELLHQERDLEGLGKEISQFHQKMEVLQFEWRQLEQEGQDLEKEEREVSLQKEIEEEARREREARVQSLKGKAGELGEETEHLAGGITEKKVFLASLEEKLKATEARIHHLMETKGTLREQILKKVKGIRECRQESASLKERIGQWEKELGDSLEGQRLKEEGLAVQREKVEALSNQWKEIEASSRYLRQELEDVRQKIHEEEIKSSEAQLRLQHLQESIRERYGTTLSPSIGTEPSESQKEEMSNRLAELKAALEGFGEVNLMALEEYQELKQRHDFLTEQQVDLQQALDALKKAIARINRTTTKRFLEAFYQVNEKFKEVFLRLFKGGQATLLLLNEEDPSTTGVDIVAQPPGKKLQNIDLLSGGEKALVATALLFGLFMIKPIPFCLLDEVDAPLDDANINRFIELIKDFSKTSQFILITHNKKTMETADTLYGITMETPGVSKVVSVRLN